MSTAAQRTGALRTAARADPQPARRAPEERPPLEVVSPRGRRLRRRRVVPLLSIVIVSLSLLLVVVGHAELAQGQVRLAGTQAEITSAQLVHRRDVVALANLENPARILRVAEETLHMSPPAQVEQLAHVPLGTPLPAAHVVPATPAASGA